jgi:Protein of unknown function (DUF4238)
VAVKRAHMVTRAYLSAWANGRDLVYVWDVETKNAGVRSLTNATVVTRAYEANVTTLDLEEHYSRIESRAIPAFRSLARGGSLNSEGRLAVIDFLEMHYARGRYADQAQIGMPVGMGNIFTGEFQMTEMRLGDRLTLDRDLNRDAARIDNLGADRWPWHIAEVESGLITGDGGVLIWRQSDGKSITSITFPIGPTKLLVIGDDLLGRALPLNKLVVSRSRRWLIDRVEGDLARSVSS